jgi:small subunit ribosomal protein S4
VNDKRVNIPSYKVKVDDVITLDEKSVKNVLVTAALEEKTELLPYIQRKGMVGKLTRMPTKEDLEVPFNTQLIIEYYSR